ncbi:hypothetical protein KEM52_005452 [Ascosphaera acerosa]|nr:hypothetical protein KEM52_005452 [Ascosphaera acerosa]
MLCAISGEVPQVPVVSHKTGHVFEKRLIEAYIAENGKDPITGEETSAEDLLELKASHTVRPRPPTLTSIPSLLSVFQEEWDALALETFALKQQLQQTRQELSTALYQHDAAVRVIARLTKERDEAREALSKVSVGGAGGPAAAAGGAGDAMQVDSAGLPPAVVESIEATQAQYVDAARMLLRHCRLRLTRVSRARLSKTRRKRPIPDGWATAELISDFTKAEPPVSAGPTGVSIRIDGTGEFALVSGTSAAHIYSIAQETTTACTLPEGSGSITDAVWARDKAVVATSTGAIKVFAMDGSDVASFSIHAGAATGLAVHATGDIVASAGVDKSYALYDLTTQQVLTRVFSDAELTCVQFHPDGHLLAAGGADGQIKIFEVKSGALAASFAAAGPLHALAFSENGT